MHRHILLILNIIALVCIFCYLFFLHMEITHVGRDVVGIQETLNRGWEVIYEDEN